MQANILGCDEKTITNHKQADPAFLEALKKGKGERKKWLRGAQDAAASKGNPALLIFLGKNELGQTDRVDVRVEDVDARIERELARLADPGEAEDAGTAGGPSPPAGDA